MKLTIFKDESRILDFPNPANASTPWKELTPTRAAAMAAEVNFTMVVCLVERELFVLVVDERDERERETSANYVT
jgi:hypothetical protein